MKNNTYTSSSSVTIPVLHDVDILFIGAGTGVIAGALSALKNGASVLAVSDLTYFGDESAGAFELDGFSAVDDPAAEFIKHAGIPDLPTPGQIKHVLELALLKAGGHALYGMRPVAVLKDSQERVTGVVLAYRTSLYAVTCKCVVDATRHGLVAKLAGVTLSGRRPLSDHMTWTVLSPVVPTSDEFVTQTIGGQISGNFDKKGPINVQRHRLVLKRPQHESTVFDRAPLEHQLRIKLNHPHLWGCAEIIPDSMTEYTAVPSGLFDEPFKIPDNYFEPKPGLLLMNGALPISSAGVAALEHSECQVKLGTRVGMLAVECARNNPARNPHAEFHLATGHTSQTQGNYDFAPSFYRPDSVNQLHIPMSAWPEIGECDVIIAGGGTGGASAGISAARTKAKTIVLETQHGLGGVGTIGQISGYYFGNRVGFTSEIDSRVFEMMGNPEGANKSRWNSNIKDICLQKMLAEAGGRAWLGSFAFGVKRNNGRIEGLLVSTPYGCGLLKTKAVVDATGNADIAAAAGAPCRTIDQYHLAVQGTGLSPRNPGDGCHNSDHTFIDDNDIVGITHAYVTTREKFKTHFDVSPLIDSRERRQIYGDIELSPLDFLAKRTFPDTICTACSNFDTHGFTVHPVFTVVPPGHDPLTAHVPFRCLLPQGLDNVLVTGLGLSAHRDALPVIRMQADVQNQGFAAGLAASLCAAGTFDMRKLDLRVIQRTLVNKGILAPEVLEHQDSFPLPESMLKAAIDGPPDLFHTALIFANPEISIVRLLEVLNADADIQRQERAALFLGLLHRKEAVPLLVKIVSERSWDQGWNYRGMGQFGMSLSSMDSLIIALGATRSALAIPPVIEKMNQLDDTAYFSHCRAVAIAAFYLSDARLAQPLHRLLSLPSMHGHAQNSTLTVLDQVNSKDIDNEARNLSLRELYLAKALYLCGDYKETGQKILESYRHDLRGHFARHAMSVLRQCQPLSPSAIDQVATVAHPTVNSDTCHNKMLWG